MKALLTRLFSLPCFFILLFFARCKCPGNSVTSTSNTPKSKEKKPGDDSNPGKSAHAVDTGNTASGVKAKGDEEGSIDGNEKKEPNNGSTPPPPPPPPPSSGTNEGSSGGSANVEGSSGGTKGSIDDKKKQLTEVNNVPNNIQKTTSPANEVLVSKGVKEQLRLEYQKECQPLDCNYEDKKKALQSTYDSQKNKLEKDYDSKRKEASKQNEELVKRYQGKSYEKRNTRGQLKQELDNTLVDLRKKLEEELEKLKSELLELDSNYNRDKIQQLATVYDNIKKRIDKAYTLHKEASKEFKDKLDELEIKYQKDLDDLLDEMKKMTKEIDNR